MLGGDSLSGALVVQTSFLGDVILTTPLIAELAKRGPVDVLATPIGATALANNPDIRTVFPYDKRGTYGAALGLWNTIKELRTRRPYDAAYLAQGSFRSGLLAMLTGAKERIGFASSTGRVLYTRQVRYRPDHHHAERLWSLAMSDCADPPTRDQIRPRLYPSDDDRRSIDLLLRRSGSTDEPFVALAPGSAWGTKRWPYYVTLATRLAEDFRIAVIGSSADSEIAAQITDVLPAGCVINGVGTLSLLASAELIGRAQAIVTNDSAPQHLASAMGTPTVTIFGPTVPEFGFGPLAERKAIAGHESLSCRPCDRHGPQRCPLGHWRCMRELTPEYISSLLTEVLNPPVPV
ncbi:MAG: lipopolysaccharide heptosyltransferase II [Gemmatimonadetes bacterium]|nr:MAG: lipopolysaccharide heptosyltransferase II [Gemmatimonadota bacterium]